MNPITTRIKNGCLKWVAAVVSTVTISVANAGTITFDFEEDPEILFENLISSQADVVWSENGVWAGTGNPDGYLSLTEAVSATGTVAILPDIDDGALITGFNLKADIRSGNGTTDRPGNGFSVSYARAEDRVINGDFSFAGPLENGTETGLVVSFDTWEGNALTDGSADSEGIRIVVDGETIATAPFPTRQGACEDLTSLQTGPQGGDESDFQRGDPNALCWAPFEVELSEDGLVTVRWKGDTVFDELQSNFFPSPGAFVIAGETDDDNAFLHIDNLVLTTIPVTGPAILITGLDTRIDGFDVRFREEGGAVLDTGSIRLTLDGESVGGAVTDTPTGAIVSHTGEMLFESESEHTIRIRANGGIDRTVTFKAPKYARVGPDQALSDFFRTRGFNFRVLQSPIEIPTTHADRESHLAGEFPEAGENLVNIFGYEMGNRDDTVVIEGVINFDQDGAPQGIFRDGGSRGRGGAIIDASRIFDDFIPGIPGLEESTDQITAEILTVVEIPEAGFYRFGFNASGGFRTTAGFVADSELAVDVGEFEGSRRSASTVSTVFFEEAGFYQLRSLWYVGEGGANLEWWTADEAGNPIALLNDDANGGLRTYRDIPRSPATVISVSPRDGAVKVPFEEVSLEVEIRNGVTSYDTGSATGTFDGEEIEISERREGDVAILSAELGTLEPFTEYSWMIHFTAGGIERLVEGVFTTAPPDLTEGVVALWNFDEEDFVDTVGDFDGSGRGTAPISFVPSRSGLGQAVSLDGVDQFIEITGGSSPDDLAFAGGSMSLSAWFRPEAFDKSWQAIIAKGEGANWRVHRRSDTGGLAHAGGIGEGPEGIDLAVGEWHHLVAITDVTGTEFGTALYVDGVHYSSNAGEATLSANGMPVMIGENPDARGRYFTGAIDDVALWDRVLSLAEVEALATGFPIQDALTLAPPVPGSITSVSVIDGDLSIEFTGTLESSESVAGPFLPVADAASPFTVDVSNEAIRFYLAR